MRVKQLFNLISDEEGKFQNPQRGRVYSTDGIAPAIYCFEGGGLQPKIVVYESDAVQPDA